MWKNLHTIQKYISYARHQNPQIVHALPHFWSPFLCFQGGLEILSLCMVSIQERFLIKSGLWWRAYGNSKKYLFTNMYYPNPTKNPKPWKFRFGSDYAHISIGVSWPKTPKTPIFGLGFRVLHTLHTWHALVGEDTMNSEADMPMEDPSSGGVRPAWITELLSSANRNPKLPRILAWGCKSNETYIFD